MLKEQDLFNTVFTKEQAEKLTKKIRDNNIVGNIKIFEKTSTIKNSDQYKKLKNKIEDLLITKDVS